MIQNEPWFFALPFKMYWSGLTHQIRDARNKIILEWSPVPVDYIEKKQLVNLLQITVDCLNEYFSNKQERTQMENLIQENKNVPSPVTTPHNGEGSDLHNEQIKRGRGRPRKDQQNG